MFNLHNILGRWSVLASSTVYCIVYVSIVLELHFQSIVQKMFPFWSGSITELQYYCSLDNFGALFMATIFAIMSVHCFCLDLLSLCDCLIISQINKITAVESVEIELQTIKKKMKMVLDNLNAIITVIKL